MNLHEFMNNLGPVLVGLSMSKENFANNMIKENQKNEEKSFCEWMQMFLSWNELLHEEDCRLYFWRLEEEK